MKSSPDVVNRLLADVQNAIDNNKCIPINRAKNLNTLSRLGILWSDALDVIYNLSYNDYVKGPEEDRDRPGTDKFWIFKNIRFGELLYIKIKILYQIDKSLLIVSFHINDII